MLLDSEDVIHSLRCALSCLDERFDTVVPGRACVQPSFTVLVEDELQIVTCRSECHDTGRLLKGERCHSYNGRGTVRVVPVRWEECSTQGRPAPHAQRQTVVRPSQSQCS